MNTNETKETNETKTSNPENVGIIDRISIDLQKYLLKKDGKFQGSNPRYSQRNRSVSMDLKLDDKTYKFRDDANVIEIRLSYSEGGINYWNSRNETKGFYITVLPVHEKPAVDPNFIVRQHVMFHNAGFKVLYTDLTHSKRYNPNLLKNTFLSPECRSAIASAIDRLLIKLTIEIE